MYKRHYLIILLASMLLSACTQFTPYRPITFPDPKSTQYVPFKCKVDERLSGFLDKDQPGTSLELCEDLKSAGTQAIQHRYYQAWKDPERTSKITGDYHLSFVEFDDQGWFADRSQMEELFTLLKTLEEKNDGSTLIYVYAHGWKHNASSCDNNVVCFSRLLERTDLIQRVNADMGIGGENPRNVVGVYIGWRGLPFGGVLNNLSFWSRKDTAARVGRGGVFELLTRLKDYRDNRREGQCLSSLNPISEEDLKSKQKSAPELVKEDLLKKYKENVAELVNRIPECAKYVDANKLQDASDDIGIPTQLVITGHSFGGLVIYEALSHALMERAGKTTRSPDGGTQYAMAESFGDFVMLVNPAFEGSKYEPLFQIATNRCYDPKQRPVMMIVTSEADNATGIAFPVGQYLGTLLQHAKSSEQKASMQKTIGHNNRYLTHHLRSDGIKAEEVGDKSACPCKFLDATLDVDVQTNLMPLFSTYFDNKLSKPSRPYGQKVDLNLSKSELSPKYTARYPYLVVSTDAGVIAGHNAIYNERFLDFTMTFIDQHITADDPWPTPGVRAPNCWPVNENPPRTKDALVLNQRSSQSANGDSCSAP